MKYKIVLPIIAVALIFLFIAGILSNPNSIKNGVRIEGVSFSGYNMSIAEKKLNGIYQNKKDKIILSYGDKTWQISFKDINASYDTRTAVRNAYGEGRGRGFIGDIFNSVAILFTGKDIQVPINFDKNLLNKKLEVFSKEINVAGKNAVIKVQSDGTLIKTPDEPGVRMDIKKTSKLVEESISSMSDQIVKIIVNHDKPKYTMKDIESIDGEIAKAETIFNQKQANRVSNIKNALEKISGTIILPGEVFSLNKTLGPRNKNNGYKDAPVILNDELVPGLGGGICQVATTVYKASLYACMEVVEREHHSFPPVYVPIGQDATIAGDSIDLKLKNNLKTSAMINCINRDNRIIISIYSKKTKDDRKVKLESQVLEVVEPSPQEIIRDGSLESGIAKTEKTEKKGYKVAVFRNIYNGSNLVSRERISLDVYRPIRGIVRIGTGQNRISQEVIQNIFPDINNMQNEFIEEPDNPPQIN